MPHLTIALRDINSSKKPIQFCWTNFTPCTGYQHKIGKSDFHQFPQYWSVLNSNKRVINEIKKKKQSVYLFSFLNTDNQTHHRENDSLFTQLLPSWHLISLFVMLQVHVLSSLNSLQRWSQIWQGRENKAPTLWESNKDCFGIPQHQKAGGGEVGEYKQNQLRLFCK